MQAIGIYHTEYVLLALLALVAALAFLAKRIGIPYPIILVLGGLGLSILPGVPRVSLDPNAVFYIFLPPLLFSAAFHISWREFRNNLVSIFMLAFGLVGFTVFGVALVTRSMFPDFDWRLGLVLGAVVATTDPISATATARRLGLPRKITDLIEAESLVNDGSGLVALKFTAALLVTGITPTFLAGTGELLYLITAGVAIGLIVGTIAGLVQRQISDSPIEITISIITPYIAYLSAENAGCSGVMATLACGLYLGRRSSGFYSLHARLESSAVWQTLDFVLNGLVFLILGLQLPEILTQIQGIPRSMLLVDAISFSLLVVLLRLVWVYPSAFISNFIRHHLRLRKVDRFSSREIFIIGWSGMRGVLALAAAISLPVRLDNGQAFPHRNLIIFLTFCVIFVTLVLQGLSLPGFIRRLGMAGSASFADEEELARREMIDAALARLDEFRNEAGPDRDELFNQLELFYRRRVAMLEEGTDQEGAFTRAEVETYDGVAQKLRSAEREVLLKLRDENKIHDEVLRTLERELDLLEVRFAPEGH